MPAMAKKKKAALYVEVDEEIVRRVRRLAEHDQRKLNAEAQIILLSGLNTLEKKAGLPPIPPLADEDE